MIRRCTVILIACQPFLYFTCKSPGIKILEKFPNGHPRIVHEFPNTKDTSIYTATQFYPDGKTYKVATVSNNKFVGKLTEYYPNGNITQIDSLLNPREIDSYNYDANITSYYENGVLAQEYSIRKGIICGLSKNYDSRGMLVKQYYLVRDTVKDGKYEEFYDNGRVALLAVYKNDTLVGTEYFFAENGDTVKYFNTYNGLLSMPYKKWLSNGNILNGVFLDSAQSAVIWTWTNTRGKLIKRQIKYPKNKRFVTPE